MENIMVQIEKTGVIPVVVINDVEDAEPLAQALCEGGLPCAEVTFRTAARRKASERCRYISRYVDRRGYGTYDGAGRQGSSGRSKNL
mgnify:CR=1 FL=1